MDTEYFFRNNDLVIWRPLGMLNSNKIYEFINFLNIQSEPRDPHFSRFVDLSRISGISVNFQDLHPVARQRKIYHHVNLTQKVKMVFLATNPLTYGMVRMYQILFDDPHFEISICENLDDAAKYLEVEPNLIKE